MADNQQQQFDGENAVSGYTLFHGKDGKSYYLKGENLSDVDVSQRVQKLRGGQSRQELQPPDAIAQAREAIIPQELKPTERAMQQTMGGSPMFTDVPKGQKGAFESAGRKGYATGSEIGAALPIIPSAIAAPGVTALALATGAGGSYLGSKIGEGGARAFGASPYDAETIGDIGGGIGGLVGGVFGPGAITSGKGAIGNVLRSPYGPLKPGVKAFSSIGKYFGGPEIADALVPGRSPEIGPFSKVPNRLPASLRSDPFSPKTIVPSPFANATPTSSIVGSAELPPVPQGNSTPFPLVQKAGATPEDVSVFPEPREPLPGDRPGAMWSIGRDELPGAAARGTPGAVDVLRNLNKPIILTPKGGVGYPGPRMSPFSPEPPQLPSGNPNPFSPMPIQKFKGGINAQGLEQSLKPISNARMIDSLSSEIDTMKTKLRNAGAATDEQRGALRKQIADYQDRLDEIRGRVQ